MPTGICSLNHFTLIAASGPDAVNFIHSQLTNDIKALTLNHACLAGYCSVKGRMLASALVWKTAEDRIVLEVPTELQESFQKRLQMFILRSKVKLDVLSNDHTIVGILGESTATQLSACFPTLPTIPYTTVHNESGTLIRLSDANSQARYQWIAPSSLYEKIAGILPAISERAWLLSDIHAGIPHIELATQDKFVPQMINYELIGGVSFKKGCYPGQEIVARSHYLGKQKRRMFLACIDHPAVQAGMEIFSDDDPTQPCGMVVNAQPNEVGSSECLVEVKLSNYNQDNVKLENKYRCRWLVLPYRVEL